MYHPWELLYTLHTTPPPHYVTTYIHVVSSLGSFFPPGLHHNLFYCVICLVGVRFLPLLREFVFSFLPNILYLPAPFLSEKVLGNEKSAWFCHPSLSCSAPRGQHTGSPSFNVHGREPLATPGPSQLFVHIHLLLWWRSRHTWMQAFAPLALNPWVVSSTSLCVE